MPKTILLTEVQPQELLHPCFQKIKVEIEQQLIEIKKAGFEVRFEVLYRNRQPQIYKCIFPENGDINLENCNFDDVT